MATQLTYPLQFIRQYAENLDGDYYFIVSRLVPYKRFDLAVKACSELGKKLVIIGDGTEKEARQCISNGLPEVAAAAQQMQAFSDIDRFAQQKDTHTASSKQKIPDFYRQQNSGKLGQILSPQQNVKCQGDQP